MINKIGQIMLYVKEQDEALTFWTEMVGFTVVSEEQNEHMRWIEIAPTKDAQTSIVLHNKEVIAKLQPELNLNTPSMMFFSDNLDSLYQTLKDKNITVGDLVTMPSGRVFNFADNENNYFAVMERN
ncbi:VOC family protein [Aureibacillus halotolerans]|uniref:Lactoylglutathione lyase n=1 Tax=Aureibacillus halotolerans TaxID=1508390 RepID=A0A4R6TVA3_9BACI|nr:VOC family protein [Aureibacillus halotolerans]TDQ37708.1 lactoylglutathione lyase [Aureibacillus halotolerans]